MMAFSSEEAGRCNKTTVVTPHTSTVQYQANSQNIDESCKQKWKRLYAEVEKSQYHIFAIDELLDELKSGDPIYDTDTLFRIIHEITHSGGWQMKQNGLYAYPHAFSAIQLDLKDYLMRDFEHCFSNITLFIKNEKREIREAAAWGLGSVTAILGKVTFELFEKEIEASKTSQDTRELEGFQVAVGLLVRNCKDITFEKFDNCMRYLGLFTHMVKENDAHISHVRVQCLKAYKRSIAAEHCKILMNETIVGENTTWFNKLIGIARDLLGDMEITVRKAAAQLLEQLLDPTNPGVQITKHFTDLFNDSKNAQKYQHRHGLNFAFNLICQDKRKVQELSPMLDTFIMHMKEQATMSHSDVSAKRGLTDAGPANAEAGGALVSLFISARQCSNTSAKYKELYNNTVHTIVKYLLSAPFIHLQDAGGHAFFRMLSLGLLSDSQKIDLLIHGYQNNYGHHAVKQSNSRNYDFIIKQVSNKSKFIESISKQIINWLTIDSNTRNPSPETREMYFKALAAILEELNPSSFHHVPDHVLDVIIYEIKSDPNERNSEFGRREAWRAMEEYLNLIVNKQCSNHVLHILESDYPNLVISAFSEDEEDVVTNALKTVAKFKLAGFNSKQTGNLDVFFGPILTLCYESKEFRTIAWPVWTTVFGDYIEYFEAHPSIVNDLFSSDAFDIENDECVYFEAISKMLFALSAAVTEGTTANIIIDYVFKNLLRHPDELVIVVNGLATITKLLPFLEKDYCVLLPFIVRFVLSFLCVDLLEVNSETMLDRETDDDFDFEDMDDELRNSKVEVDELHLYIQKLSLCSELFKSIQALLNPLEAELVATVMETVIAAVQEQENGTFYARVVGDKLGFYGIECLKISDVYDLLQEYEDPRLAENYQNKTESTASEMFDVIANEEIEDDDLDSMLASRIRRYYIIEILIQCINEGKYKPTVDDIIHDFPKLILNQKLDEEDEDNACLLLENIDDPHTINTLNYGVLSFFSPTTQLKTLIDISIPVVLASTDSKTLIDKIIIYLGLIKTEKKIPVDQGAIFNLAVVTDMIVKTRKLENSVIKVLTALLLLRVRVSRINEFLVRPNAYCKFLRLLDSCFEVSRSDISSNLRKNYFDEIAATAKESWHRKLENGASIPITAVLVTLLSLEPQSKDVLAIVCQLVIDSLTNDNLEEKRNPMFAIVRKLSTISKPLNDGLRYPKPTPLLTVKDNCTFVENRK